MKSKFVALITTIIYFILASCTNSTQNNQTTQENDSLVKKQPVIQSVNCGVIEKDYSMGGDKDFVEMNRLLDVDSIDVIELYWRQTKSYNDRFLDCSVKYEKKDSALTIWAKEGDEELKINKIISKEKLKEFVNINFGKTHWKDIEAFLDGKIQKEETETKTEPTIGKIRIVSKSSNPYQISINGEIIGTMVGYETYDHQVSPGYYHIKAVQTTGYVFKPTINNRDVQIKDGQMITITIGYKDK
ncbi:MAG: hypothetical protein IJ150_04450 [Bacteroidales bacterium]|nr:hypothetical protein [Bacteroidales bacterium]